MVNIEQNLLEAQLFFAEMSAKGRASKKPATQILGVLAEHMYQTGERFLEDYHHGEDKEKQNKDR